MLYKVDYIKIRKVVTTVSDPLGKAQKYPLFLLLFLP